MKAPAAKSHFKPNAKSAQKEKSSTSAVKTTIVKVKAEPEAKNHEESSGIQNAENVAPEKLEEIVESLVSAVITKVEAETVELNKEKLTTGNDMKAQEEITRKSSDAEERRRRVERGDSEARLGEILQEVFATPLMPNNPTKTEKPATRTTRKASAPVVSKPPRPPRPSSAARHSISKSPAKTAANTKVTRTVNKPDAAKADALKNSVPPPLPKTKPEEPHVAEQKKAPQAPPRKKQSKEMLKTDSKKSIGSVASEQPKLEKQGTIEEKGNPEATKPKAPSRQSSTGKMVTKPVTEKRQEMQLQSLKSVDQDEHLRRLLLFHFSRGSNAAQKVTDINEVQKKPLLLKGRHRSRCPPLRGDAVEPPKTNQDEKPKAPVKSATKAAPNKVGAKASGQAKKSAAPPAKTSRA
ncbi:hypothetical protein Y032_0278g1146 [Ancylostoma ceylanicum]|uniref:Uncharacterized protein n=1 Tax=Ancylostoma ceylanicum TaxID=53326 RepID=A0A016S7M4_9BILA|nr:hypothetical protein Y032_0278g1146 [Ancylostoma ceylanicum]